MNKGLTLRMNQCPVKRQWPRLFEHVRNGYLTPSDVLTHRIPLEHIAEGYHIFSAKLDGCIKPLVVPGAGDEGSLTMAYTPEKPPIAESSEQLRARIPGWGVDLDPKDRPSVPKLQYQPDKTGARWDFPDRQPEKWPRERSIEHKFLTPVFGTACPPKGLSGVIRRTAYRKYSEGRAAQWLLLIAADRVDAWESHLRSFSTLRPDNPITETGVLS
jgi:hypothetical protein